MPNSTKTAVVTFHAGLHQPGPPKPRTRANGSKLSEDWILGEAWLKAWAAVRVFLNGELGRLDDGRLDSHLIQIASAAGFTESEMDGGGIRWRKSA